MKIPEVVVFDLGKVLVDFDYGIAARGFAARGKITHTEIKSFIDHSPLLYRFETGLMTKEAFYKEICTISGFDGCVEEFCEIFADIFSPIEPMIAMHAQLRERGVPTFIFSNTNEIAVRHIKQRFPFFANFTGYVYSFEQGAMKPDHKIYEVVEKMSGKSGGDILYIDDRAENIDTGVKRGWQTILQQDSTKTISEVSRLGLLQ